MQHPRHAAATRYLKPAAGLILVPLAVWVVVVAVVPTECARKTIVQRLTKASGRTVTLEKVSVGLLGGVRLENLTIGAPDSANDPWLRVPFASVDICLAQLLFGSIHPTEVVVDGLDLRVLRGPDGRLELADFVRAEPAESTGGSSSAAASTETPTPMSIRVHGGHVLIVDAPTQTRLEIQNIEGQGTCVGTQVKVSELSGTASGGTIRLAAAIERGGTEPMFEGQLRASGITLGEGMKALEYLVPVIAGTPNKLSGRLSLDLYVRGRGDSRDEIQSSLVGQGQIGLDPVDLTGSHLLSALGSLVANPNPKPTSVGSIHSKVVIKQGRVNSDDVAIDMGRVPFSLTGWTDFDGHLDYQLKSDGLAERIQGKAKDLLTELRIDVNDLGNVRLHGTLDHLAVTVNGLPIEDRSRLREIGRRLRDKVMR